MTPTLALRRARRDLGILLVWIAIVAFAVVLAVGQPRLLLASVDSGARQAVAAAGSATDVLVTGSVTASQDSDIQPVLPDAIEGLAAAIPHRLPAGLRAVYAGGTLSVLGPSIQLSSINGSTRARANPIAVQIAMITAQNAKALRLDEGSLPQSSAADIDVVLSADSARAAGLSVGSVAEVPIVGESAGSGGIMTLRVVGIVSESKGASAAWTDTPNLWKPTVPGGSSAPIRITVLASEAGVASASSQNTEPFKANLRIRMNAQRFTAAIEAQVAAELVALAVHPNRVAGLSNADLDITSRFGFALQGFPTAERATVAQVSLMAAGVIGVAAAVLLLVAKMLVARREAELALERARGASLASIASRALLETLVAEVIAVAIGVVVLLVALPGPVIQPLLLGLVLLIALLAVPVQTVLMVRGTWTGRKVPANRSDRVELDRRVRARRIAIELTIVALAVGAFVSLTTRGLLETQTNGIDPLLAAAPLLLAATVTIIVLRLYRCPLMLGIAIGRRSNGALGLLAAVRAQHSIAVLPLLALTLAVALAVGGGLLASTVRAGQEAASWQRVGADVRVRATATEPQVASIAAAPGVTGATAFRVEDGVQLRLTGGTDFGTVIAVDSRFADFVEKLPAGGASAGGAAALRKLAKRVPASDPLPVVVDPQLASEISSKNVGIYLGLTFVTIHVVGVTDENPSGYLDSPFIFVDSADLATHLAKTVNANTVLVNGPGATAAVKSLRAPNSAIQTRAHWLSERRHRALVSGVNQAIIFATIATAVLAVLAVIVTLLSGARERGRSLALVRTLGLPARLGWWLALAELAPVLLAALIGGVAAGVGIVVLLEPAMGLGELAGGLGNPAPTLSVSVIAGLVLAAVGLLLIAVLIEIAVRRRDRLSEVLRVGESV